MKAQSKNKGRKTLISSLLNFCFIFSGGKAQMDVQAV
jgi:hypothetical protein